MLLIWRQHSISLADVFSDNDDCAIANGKPGTEQFGHFSVSGEGKGMVPLVTGSPTLMAGATRPANGAGLMYSLIN